MKIKQGFALYPVGGEQVVVPVGERTTEFSGMIRLNSTGAFLWKQLESDCTREALCSALCAEYGISDTLAVQAVDSFLEQLSSADVIES